jgi:hypothetical protein
MVSTQNDLPVKLLPFPRYVMMALRKRRAFRLALAANFVSASKPKNGSCLWVEGRRGCEKRTGAVRSRIEHLCVGLRLHRPRPPAYIQGLRRQAENGSMNRTKAHIT